MKEKITAAVPPENPEHFGEVLLTFKGCEKATGDIATPWGFDYQNLEHFAPMRGAKVCELQEAEF